MQQLGVGAAGQLTGDRVGRTGVEPLPPDAVAQRAVASAQQHHLDEGGTHRKLQNGARRGARRCDGLSRERRIQA
jgi:hypothetical protein